MDEGIPPQIYAEQKNVGLAVQQLAVDRSPGTGRVPLLVTGGELCCILAQRSYGMGGMPRADNPRPLTEQLRQDSDTGGGLLNGELGIIRIDI
ncbi:hypothetical protein D3C75_1242670 [compost metagenome]